jgi:hypothetical protein
VAADGREDQRRQRIGAFGTVVTVLAVGRQVAVQVVARHAHNAGLAFG